jgi:hypothetical protein
MLYNLIITPIETIVGWTFFFFNKKFAMFGPAAAIVGVSLIIDFLALPLYNIADSIQEKERKIQKSLEKGIKRIKTCFKGDEQFMMLQTYYKQNNYHPLYVAYSRQMVGSLPVGIMTKGDLDLPYWPTYDNAVFKEIWGHTTGKYLWVLADILKMYK